MAGGGPNKMEPRGGRGGIELTQLLGAGAVGLPQVYAANTRREINQAARRRQLARAGESGSDIGDNRSVGHPEPRAAGVLGREVKQSAVDRQLSDRTVVAQIDDAAAIDFPQLHAALVKEIQLVPSDRKLEGIVKAGGQLDGGLTIRGPQLGPAIAEEIQLITHGRQVARIVEAVAVGRGDSGRVGGVGAIQVGFVQLDAVNPLISREEHLRARSHHCRRVGACGAGENVSHDMSPGKRTVARPQFRAVSGICAVEE